MGHHFRKILGISIIVILQASYVYGARGMYRLLDPMQVQYLNKAIEWAGEFPTQYMQETNRKEIESIAESLKSFVPGNSSSEQLKEVEVLKFMVSEALRYHDVIEREIVQKEGGVTEAVDILFQEQIVLRRNITRRLIEFFETGRPSYGFMNLYLIYFWEALSKPPRMKLSQAQINEMRRELKPWLKLTELTLEKTSGDPKLADLSYREYFGMIRESLIETTVFQRDMLKYLPWVDERVLRSAKNYAAVQEYIFRTNAHVQDFTILLEVNRVFPVEVRDAYSGIEEMMPLRNAESFLQSEPAKNLKELWVSLDPLRLKQGRGSHSEILEFIEKSGADGKVTQLGEVAFNWSNDSLHKSYYQTIDLMMDMIVLQWKSENYPEEGPRSNMPFDPDSVKYSDFLTFENTIKFFADSILESHRPPLMAPILAKALAEFVPLYSKMAGVDAGMLQGMVDSYIRFQSQRPHDPYLTKLALHLYQSPEASRELRLVALDYYRNSAHSEGNSKALINTAVETRLRDSVQKEIRQWTMERGEYSRANMNYANDTTGEVVGDSGWMKELLVVANSKYSHTCGRLFRGN